MGRRGGASATKIRTWFPVAMLPQVWATAGLTVMLHIPLGDALFDITAGLGLSAVMLWPLSRVSPGVLLAFEWLGSKGAVAVRLLVAAVVVLVAALNLQLLTTVLPHARWSVAVTGVLAGILASPWGRARIGRIRVWDGVGILATWVAGVALLVAWVAIAGLIPVMHLPTTGSAPWVGQVVLSAAVTGMALAFGVVQGGLSDPPGMPGWAVLGLRQLSLGLVIVTASIFALWGNGRLSLAPVSTLVMGPASVVLQTAWVLAVLWCIAHWLVRSEPVVAASLGDSWRWVWRLCPVALASLAVWTNGVWLEQLVLVVLYGIPLWMALGLVPRERPPRHDWGLLILGAGALLTWPWVAAGTWVGPIADRLGGADFAFPVAFTVALGMGLVLRRAQ